METRIALFRKKEIRKTLHADTPAQEPEIDRPFTPSIRLPAGLRQSGSPRPAEIELVEESAVLKARVTQV